MLILAYSDSRGVGFSHFNLFCFAKITIKKKLFLKHILCSNVTPWMQRQKLSPVKHKSGGKLRRPNAPDQCPQREKLSQVLCSRTVRHPHSLSEIKLKMSQSNPHTNTKPGSPIVSIILLLFQVICLAIVWINP